MKLKHDFFSAICIVSQVEKNGLPDLARVLAEVI